jgi:alkanesulfonate monooxygenase SsuD/methylene tetrahydromethanopterin reductase-like flavin-dependent oxidoreductase (luciferase family)
LVGAPEQVRDELERLATDLQIDEIMIIAVMHDYVARQRSYRLIAEAVGIS